MSSAETTIAGLPAASAPLAGTEVAPVETVGAVTEKATTQQIAEVLLALSNLWTGVQTFTGYIATTDSVFPTGTAHAYITSPADGALAIRMHDGTFSTVAALPAAAGGLEGCRSWVTDSSVAAAGNFGATVVGGGSNHVPVYCDGGAWRIGG